MINLPEIAIRIEDTYQKQYKMNAVGLKGATTTVAIPPEVIDRNARKANLTPEDFIKKFQLVAHYNSFEGILYTFEEK